MFLAKPPADAVVEADLLLDVEELLGTRTALQIGEASSDSSDSSNSSDSSDTSTDSDDETRRPERCDELQVSTRAHTYSRAVEPVGGDDLTVSTLALHWAAASIASWRMGVVCWTWELSRSWLLCACAGGALAAGLFRAVPRSGVSVRQG